MARNVALAAASASIVALGLLLVQMWKKKQEGKVSEKKASTRSLELASDEVVELLKSRQPVRVEGLPSSAHWLPPHIPKTSGEKSTGSVTWTELGDLVVRAEKDLPPSGSVSGDRWISLRLDGTGFSKVVKRLRRHGVLESHGFSTDFATIMQSVCQHLLDEFHAKIGYTQSDEITLIIAPASVIRGEQQPHLRSGRVIKLCSVAAASATAFFNMKIAKLCLDKGLEPGDYILSHFDCRLGHFSSWEEARAILLWRAYDCSVNGVSDCVHHAKGSGQKVTAMDTKSKLLWLYNQNLLPLPNHQACGSYYVKVRRVIQGTNPKTGEVVSSSRSKTEKLEGHVLQLAREERMIPNGDELEK
eukprot:TRINITY_DN114032_c0_g1_i1.p1 TRINITY_DN114032_c0_g1~~TRINITY_DN114032_c0_g1_i1.p1  ORF type:complete len:359 (-),score=54.36 TRINITY_DN114032_c0_g1_i1:167-1243(-)